MRLTVKRLIDIALATVALVALAPVLIVLAVATRVTMGKPVLFRHQRPGKDGRLFHMIKYRTMTEPGPGENRYLSDDARVTRFGRFLRSYSLDELPELFNILKGEMSLVGPRPLLVEYLDKYTPTQARRHEMKPGVTGLAQISGRRELPFSRRLDLDVWYVDNWSIWLDIKIIFATVGTLLKGRGHISEQFIEEIDDTGFWSDSRDQRQEGPPDS